MIQGLILVNESPKSNKYTHTHFASDLQVPDFVVPLYTFALTKEKVTELGHYIELNKASLSVTFLGSWKNIAEFRTVDFGDVPIFGNPCIIAPLFERAKVRNALMMISKACELSVLWESNKAGLGEIKKYSQFLEKINIKPYIILSTSIWQHNRAC